MKLVGDSLSSAHRIPVESGWVALLEKRIASVDETPAVVVNHSKGGKTLADALMELPVLLDKHQPDVVVLELGGNDAMLGATGVELGKLLGQLVDMAQERGARVALLGFVVPAAFDKEGVNATLRDAYAATAAEQDVPLLASLLDGISDKPDMLLDDGIHPNAEAQARVLENAWPSLAPLVTD